MAIQILLAFVPWILFGIIAGPGFLQLEMAIVISLVASLVFGLSGLRKGFVLAWGTLLFFVFALLSVNALRLSWVMHYMAILPYLVLAMIAWGSMLVGKPFTMQYAKQRTPRERWQSPAFIRGSRIITTVWALIFTMQILLALAKMVYVMRYPWLYRALSDVLILAGILFTVWFPEWYRARAGICAQ